MKKLSLLLSLAVLITAATSCGNQTNENQGTHDHAHDHHDHEHHGHDHEHHDHDHEHEPLALNDGERWVVNDEMKPYVANAESLLENYVNEEQTDHHVLATSLDEQNDELIKSCTMTGQGHDELHKWLHSHLVLVDSLKKTDDPEEAERLVNDIQLSYEVYHQHFQ